MITMPVTVNKARVGTLAVFQDASYITAQTSDMWRRALACVAGEKDVVDRLYHPADLALEPAAPVDKACTVASPGACWRNF